MDTDTSECPRCKNHCSKDELRCRRGKEYFAQNAPAASAPDPTPHENDRGERLLDLFHQCFHHLRHAHGHVGGLRRVLHFLHHHGTMTQRELQDLAGIRSASMSELLQKGEAGGFIARMGNHADRRTFDVSLTRQGQRSIQEKQGAQDQAQSSPFAGLTTGETADLEKLLSRLLLSWDRGNTGNSGFGSRPGFKGLRRGRCFMHRPGTDF